MGAYNCKYVRDQLPPFITEAIDNYEGSCDYDGDMWVAASDYIEVLEYELKQQVENSQMMFNPDLYNWLSTRKATPYVGGPVINTTKEE